jgi:hypothetical protein
MYHFHADFGEEYPLADFWLLSKSNQAGEVGITGPDIRKNSLEVYYAREEVSQITEIFSSTR